MMTTTPPLHQLEFRLSYADTDPAGILYYAAWFPWMERMQSEWFWMNGLRQDELAATHGFWTVTCHTECDYLVPVGLFDHIRSELRIGRIGRASFDMEHEFHRIAEQGDQLVGRARITVVTVTPEGRATALPTLLRDHLDAWTDGHALTL